jgi:hypothetical protein
MYKNNGETACQMCNEVMTKCDFEYCDICPECLDGD